MPAALDDLLERVLDPCRAAQLIDFLAQKRTVSNLPNGRESCRYLIVLDESEDVPEVLISPCFLVVEPFIQ